MPSPTNRWVTHSLYMSAGSEWQVNTALAEYDPRASYKVLGWTPLYESEEFSAFIYRYQNKFAYIHLISPYRESADADSSD